MLIPSTYPLCICKEKLISLLKRLHCPNHSSNLSVQLFQLKLLILVCRWTQRWYNTSNKTTSTWKNTPKGSTEMHKEFGEQPAAPLERLSMLSPAGGPVCEGLFPSTRSLSSVFCTFPVNTCSNPCPPPLAGNRRGQNIKQSFILLTTALLSKQEEIWKNVWQQSSLSLRFDRIS